MPQHEVLRNEFAGPANTDATAQDRRGFIRITLPRDEHNAVCLIREEGPCFCARFLDISIGGARLQLLEHPVNLEEGEMLVLKDCVLEPFSRRLEDMLVQLIWVRGDQIGLLFETLME